MNINRVIKNSLSGALLLIFVLLSSITLSASTPAPKKVKVLIAFTRHPGQVEQALVHSFGGDIKYTYHLVPAIAASVPEAALDGLRHNPLVVAVEPDLKAHLVDAELDNSWGVNRIGAGIVHGWGNKGAGVKVGILDTGIDIDHPDLNYDPSCSQSFIAGESLDDGHSHGTHTAGTVAALDNDTGVVGVTPQSTLCIYKVFNNNGDTADYSDIIAAIERAVADGVQVTNNSYGSTEDPGDTVKDAFDNAYAAGVLHVAAAGNNDIPILFPRPNCIYPARWDSVIATAATTQSDEKDYYSSVCNEVEMAAPGTQIYSTMPGGGYGYKSGTSMASPHVAGTAALVLAAYPEWSNDQVRTQLQTTADELGDSGRDSWYGYGLVDADEAAASTNNPPVADGQAVVTDEDTQVAITLTASDVDGDHLTYAVVTYPSHGTLSGMVPDVTYMADLDYHGFDNFTFQANDGQVDSNIATVSITVASVNDPPETEDQTVTAAEDTPIEIVLTASDVDGDPLTYNLVTEPSHGALSGTAPNLTYTPEPSFSGMDSFTFVAYDGQVDSDVATVSITVWLVNDPPEADYQAVVTDEDTPVAITLTGSDPDDDPLTFSVVMEPPDGTLSGSAPNLTYSPDPDYNGPDSFTFVANDGQVDSDIATVSITVTASATIVDAVASSEVSVAGTVSENYTHTHLDDGASEAITERDSGGKPINRYSHLEHKWIFNVTPSNAVTLYANAWSSGSNDGDSFIFAYSTDDASYANMFAVDNTSDAGHVAYVFPALLQGTVYVRVIDSDHSPGNRAQDTVYVDHLYIRSEIKPGDPPVAPTDLIASAISATRIDLTWTDNADDEYGFQIERSLDGADWSQIDTVGADVTSYADTAVSSYTTYNYQVRAYNGSGSSGYSNMDSVTTPDGLSLTAIGYKLKGVYMVDLIWSGSSASSFDVYRDGNQIDSGVSGNYYTDDLGKRGGGIYLYQVCEAGSPTNCSNIVTVDF